MGRFINPFTDFGFKFLFGREVEKELLIDFLNDLLVGEHVITDIQFLNSEQQPEVKTERGLIYDIYCVTDTGERIIVEMQNREQPYFKIVPSSIFSRAITQQEKGSLELSIGCRVRSVLHEFRDGQGYASKIRTDIILSDRDTGSSSATSSRRFLSNCRTSTKRRMNVKMILNAGFICTKSIWIHLTGCLSGSQR